MGTVRLCQTDAEHEAWDRYVHEIPNAHYFQTYGWLRSYEPMGFTPHVLVHEMNGVIHGGVGFLSVKVPLSPWRIFIIPHGPLPADPNSLSWMPLMQRLDTLCWEQGAIYAQLYPHELTDKATLLPRLEALGFTAPAMFTGHRFSSTPVIINLEGMNEEEVLKGLRKNTRYYIRRAQGGMLSIRTDTDKQTFDHIYRLLSEHGEFKGYHPRPYRSLKSAWEWYAPRDSALFIQAWCADTLVGAILVVFTGRTAYYLAGAMRREFSKDYPAELMHWHAISEALRRQMNAYDLTSVGVSGVAQFKAGFRPNCRSWHDPRTKVYRPHIARVLNFLDKRCRPFVRQLGRLRARVST